MRVHLEDKRVFEGGVKGDNRAEIALGLPAPLHKSLSELKGHMKTWGQPLNKDKTDI